MKLTREEAKEMLPIIQAWADGQTVDWYDPSIGWRLSGFTLDFDKKPNFYRIKPEPRYRPFKTREECWEEMHQHPDFGWVLAKDSKIMYHICVVGIGYVLIDSMSPIFSEAFAEYKFTDGTPFGIKEE